MVEKRAAATSWCRWRGSTADCYILVANFGDSDEGLERMYLAGKLVVDTSERHKAETGGDREDFVIKEMSLLPGNAYTFMLPK